MNVVRPLLVLSVHLLCLTVFALRVHAAEPTPKATDDSVVPPLMAAILNQADENPKEFLDGDAGVGCPVPVNDQLPAVVTAIEGTLSQLEFFQDYTWGVALVDKKPSIWVAAYVSDQEENPLVAWVGGFDPKTLAGSLGREPVGGGVPLPLNGEYGNLGTTVAPMIDILPGVSNIEVCGGPGKG